MLERLLEPGLTLEKARSILRDYLLSNFNDIDFSNNSPNLFILDALSVLSKYMNNQIQITKRDLNIEEAEGMPLYNIGLIASGLSFKKESKTLVRMLLEGENGTFLKKGFEIRDNMGNKFFLKNDTKIHNTSINEVVLEAEGNEEKKFILKFGKFSGAFISSDADWMFQLRNKINENSEVQSFAFALVKDGKLVIVAKYQGFDIFLASGLKYHKIKVEGIFEAEEFGEIDFEGMPVFTFPGLKSIEIKGIIKGNKLQSDEEYRVSVIEKIQNFTKYSSRLRDAILADNPDVAHLSILENDTENENELNIPSKHIECVVVGGDSHNLAFSIWNHKRGVSTYGNVEVRIVDEDGNMHLVKYSRPEAVNGLLTIKIFSDNQIEINSIREGIFTLIEEFIKENNEVGKNFALGRLGSFLLQNYKEAYNISVEAKTSKNGGNITNYEAGGVIKINKRETLDFNIQGTKIEVPTNLKNHEGNENL